MELRQPKKINVLLYKSAPLLRYLCHSQVHYLDNLAVDLKIIQASDF
jgi:hypothetical protein